jgi:UDP-GlcNAc:undecaprenyl-phosphate GlcNAc-1-phosphate transferase
MALTDDSKVYLLPRHGTVEGRRIMSKKGLIKLFLMVLFAAISFGIAGVICIITMHLLSLVSIGQDSASSHGISLLESSRLGGLSIFLIVIFYTAALVVGTNLTLSDVLGGSRVDAGIIIVFCSLLGLAEDIKNDFLTPMLRLGLKFLMLGVFFWSSPGFIPEALGIFGLDRLIAIPVLAWVLTTIFCVGFINAINMADGANGLVSGIGAVVFFIFFTEYADPLSAILMFACCMFLILNVVSGRFFLGDMGSYGIGSTIAILGLYAVSQGKMSPAFMAAMLAYPCLDFVSSLTRRILQRRSPFSPDNDHLHNRLHFQIKKILGDGVLSNSVTGLLISGGSAGLVLVAYIREWWPITSDTWIWLFILQSALYLGVFKLSGRSKPPPQHSGPL